MEGGERATARVRPYYDYVPPGTFCSHNKGIPLWSSSGLRQLVRVLSMAYAAAFAFAAIYGRVCETRTRTITVRPAIRWGNQTFGACV